MHFYVSVHVKEKSEKSEKGGISGKSCSQCEKGEKFVKEKDRRHVMNMDRSSLACNKRCNTHLRTDVLVPADTLQVVDDF